VRKLGDWIARRPEFAILALGALLRALWLTRASLWSDEAVTLAIAQAPASGIPVLVDSLETTPALHFLLMHYWLALWRDPLSGLRAFSALCALAALGLYWRLCRRLAPGQAALALTLGAVSSLWIHAAQSGRCYALFLLLAAAQALLTLRLRERWSPGEAAAYAAVALAGLATHHYYHFLLLSLGASALLAPSLRKASAGRWLALHAAIWAVALPLLLPSALAQRRLFLPAWAQTAPFSAEVLAATLGAFLFDAGYLGLAWPGAAAALGWALAAALLAAAPRLLREQNESARFCLANILLPIGAAATLEAVNGRPVFQPRFLIFLGLFLYPLLALAAEAAAARAWRGPAALALSVCACAGTAAYYASNLVFDPRLPVLSSFIRRAWDPGEPVVHWGALEYAALRYYYLPERRHYLLDLTPGDARYGRLPGYQGLIRPQRLAALPSVVVVDAERRAFPHRTGRAAGPLLLRLLEARRQ
jgi:mannosyltransferase